MIRERNTGEERHHDRTEHHVTVTVATDLKGNLTVKSNTARLTGRRRIPGAMPATLTDKADKTKDAIGQASATPAWSPSLRTRPEFNNSYILPATLATANPQVKTGIRAYRMLSASWPLLGRD